MTPEQREIVADFHDGMSYSEAYGRLALAGVRDPHSMLIGERKAGGSTGWGAEYERPAMGGWLQ